MGLDLEGVIDLAYLARISISVNMSVAVVFLVGPSQHRPVDKQCRIFHQNLLTISYFRNHQVGTF